MMEPTAVDMACFIRGLLNFGGWCWFDFCAMKHTICCKACTQVTDSHSHIKLRGYLSTFRSTHFLIQVFWSRGTSYIKWKGSVSGLTFHPNTDSSQVNHHSPGISMRMLQLPGWCQACLSTCKTHVYLRKGKAIWNPTMKYWHDGNNWTNIYSNCSLAERKFRPEP